MDLSTFHELRSAAGEALLDRIAAAGSLDDAVALRLGSRLRRDHAPHLVAAALTQARLRQRAAAKFGATAQRMWFTADALEQATHPVVAAHRAARVRAGLPAGASLTDLCCGIGSDLRAFADAGLDAQGVDQDPATAAMAAANCPGVCVECADATIRAINTDAVFTDPARRGAHGRVFDPNAYRPPWSFLTGLLANHPAAAAKVAPGIAHDLVPAGVEIEWVSLDGAVKEAALYSGALRSGARRRATLLPGGATLSAPEPDTAEQSPPVGPVGRWLHEPDGAVIRAHLVGAVAAEVGGWLIDPRIAYLSTDHPVASPFARSYQVTDVLPFSVKGLRALLRSRGVGTLTVKKRGSALDPDQLRRELLRGGHGSAAATLVLTRIAGAPIALLVEPVRTEG